MDKVLIAIRSCVRDAKRGDNQASRDTWLKEVEKYGFDYKFFIGDGSPVEGLDVAYTGGWGVEYLGRKQESISEITPKQDEEIVSCPDDYFHMPYKLREICRYAVKSGYDYVFTPCDDVFVDVSRLSTSGFEGHDYIGHFWNCNAYAHGGPGFWLSKKACDAIANSPITSAHDDEWAGLVMTEVGIVGYHDPRYAYDSDMLREDTISLHLSFTAGSYDPKWMLMTAKNWPVDFSTLPKRTGRTPTTIYDCVQRSVTAKPFQPYVMYETVITQPVVREYSRFRRRV